MLPRLIKLPPDPPICHLTPIPSSGDLTPDRPAIEIGDPIEMKGEKP